MPTRTLWGWKAKPCHHWKRTAWRRHVCTRCGRQRRTVGPLWWPRHIYTDTTWHGIPMQVTGAPPCAPPQGVCKQAG